MSGAPLLAVEGLSAGYGDYPVLHELSLSLRAGEKLAMLGPNGHGKTTLLRVVSGLLRPTAGSVRFDGRDLARLAPSEIVALGISHIPQGDLIFPQMKVGENLLAGAYLSWRSRARRLERVLAIFPPLRERYGVPARVLSGGERRMLAIARGLMSDPRLLIVDEPSLGLAPIVRDSVYAVLRDVVADGISLLLVEERASHLAGLVDQVCVVESGRVAASGSCEAMLASGSTLLAQYFG
jgi:branched-chain amino acid transport system ATP-binding protein